MSVHRGDSQRAREAIEASKAGEMRAGEPTHILYRRGDLEVISYVGIYFEVQRVAGDEVTVRDRDHTTCASLQSKSTYQQDDPW